MTLPDFQFLDQRVELRVVHEALDPLVIDQADRRIGTRTEALGFDEREAAVGGGFAIVDAQLLFRYSPALSPSRSAQGRQVQTPIFQVPTSFVLYML